MKNLSLLCALTLLTAAAAGCSDGFQTVSANTSGFGKTPTTTPAPVKDTAGEDVIVPSGESSGTTGGTTGGATEPETQTTTDPVAPAEDPFVSPTGSDCYRYLFVSTRDGYENVYSASTCSKEEATEVTHNTNEETRFRNLEISNDGKKITYDYLYSGAPDWQMSIEDVATIGTGGQNISGCRSAALSPSNDRVVYVCAAGLYFIDERDTSLSRMIASDNGDARTFEKAVWSPVTTETDASHDKVIFSAKESDGSDKLYVFDAKTGGKTRPLYEQFNGDGHDVVLKGSSADISRDGKTLTFVRKSTYGGPEQVWACDLMFDQTFTLENSLSTSISHVPVETKESLCVNPRVLTNEGANVNPHWTSNGKHIFFTSDRDGNKEIYVMKADGSEEANLTKGTASDRDVTPFPATRFDPNRLGSATRASLAGQ